MYVIYCQNKPKSEFIVAEYDTYFDVSHSLDSFCLLGPVRQTFIYGSVFHLSGNPAGHPVQTDH